MYRETGTRLAIFLVTLPTSGDLYDQLLAIEPEAEMEKMLPELEKVTASFQP